LLSPSPATGAGIAIIRLQWFPSVDELEWEDVIKTCVVMGESVWNEEHLELNGIEMIVDCSKSSWKLAVKAMSIKYAWMCLNLFLDAFPARYRKLHLINLPFFISPMKKFVEMLLPEKFIKRIIMHPGDFKTLLDHYPKEILPQWLHGTLSEEEAYNDIIYETMRNNVNAEFYRILAEKIRTKNIDGYDNECETGIHDNRYESRGSLVNG